MKKLVWSFGWGFHKEIQPKSQCYIILISTRPRSPFRVLKCSPLVQLLGMFGLRRVPFIWGIGVVGEWINECKESVTASAGSQIPIEPYNLFLHCVPRAFSPESAVTSPVSALRESTNAAAVLKWLWKHNELYFLDTAHDLRNPINRKTGDNSTPNMARPQNTVSQVMCCQLYLCEQVRSFHVHCAEEERGAMFWRTC